jgi:hypothetical protein
MWGYIKLINMELVMALYDSLVSPLRRSRHSLTYAVVERFGSSGKSRILRMSQWSVRLVNFGYIKGSPVEI